MPNPSPTPRQHFNSRPSARGDVAVHATIFFKAFQFTPLREGRHQFLTGIVVQFISIHAPPRGATAVSAVSRDVSGHFNSRPSARGDGRCTTIAKRTGYFNSRPSARGDKSGCSSITALTNFNSRPSARGDYTFPADASTAQLFQFTPLREGRHAARLQ